MSFKIFPKTCTGNQFRIEFEYEEEMKAFQEVMANIQKVYEDHADGREKRNKSKFKIVWLTLPDSEDRLIVSRLFRTDLQYEIAKEREQDLRKILHDTFSVIKIKSKNRVLLQCHDPSEA